MERTSLFAVSRVRSRIFSSCVARCYATSSSTTNGRSHKSTKKSPRTPTPKMADQPTRKPSPQSSNIQQPHIPPRSSISAKLQELPPDLARKQWHAQKLYEAGQTVIYRPPSHFGIYAASYTMGASAITVAGSLAYTSLWAWDMPADLPWFVPVAHRIGIFVFSGVGWLTLMRSLSFIHAIDLVSVDGLVKMSVQVRRPLPFLRPKQYLIAPYQFQMDHKFVQQLEYPDFMHTDEELAAQGTPRPKGILSSLGRAISKGLYYPFASTRRLLTLEGFMTVNLEGTNRSKVKLDTQGLFSNEAKDLVQMGVIIT